MISSGHTIVKLTAVLRRVHALVGTFIFLRTLWRMLPGMNQVLCKFIHTLCILIHPHHEMTTVLFFDPCRSIWRRTSLLTFCECSNRDPPQNHNSGGWVLSVILKNRGRTMWQKELLVNSLSVLAVIGIWGYFLILTEQSDPETREGWMTGRRAIWLWPLVGSALLECLLSWYLFS